MPDDSSADTGNEESAYIGDIDSDAVVDEAQLQLTPHQHEQLKTQLHGSSQFDEIKRADTRYLVVGRGGEEGPGKRRLEVCEQLDDRRGAAGYRLEDFGFTTDEIDLWAPAFDLLAAMASHIVGVLEDFDGGHVWELGYLYHQQRHVRDRLWLLKRLYESETEMRRQYDNGMAASHLAALEEAAGDRVIGWGDEASLRDAVEGIP
ncbi:aminopeptidase [Halolamina sp. CBA1230]|uniref:aminopeptidase n=1 Tax=Halolamina sp. CBA1230 TaxID=1853690 RepID=UPI0009A1C41C|nr:aminopeptidase [Halolamina sp. CBA1230]QKY20514.1 aminopeptidase [Halolamina sp. CBA1230]